MKYVIGIDGGGTKTQGILCDETGRVYGVCTCGPSNHQFISETEVRKNIENVIDGLLEETKISAENIAYIYFGLAGCDSEADKKFLTELLSCVTKGIPYCVENDIWPALSSVSGINWGTIIICGTGFNMAVLDKEGNPYTLRALEYEHGNLSATDQLAAEALHFAFQSEEHTGIPTLLENRIPEIIGVRTMADVLNVMELYPEKVYGNREIVQEIFTLARKRDIVCQKILENMGREIGKMAGCFMRHAGVADENVPVVLSGSIFSKAVSKIHIDAMCLEMRKVIPDFTLLMNCRIPAAGACVQALKKTGNFPDNKFYEILDDTISGL